MRNTLLLALPLCFLSCAEGVKTNLPQSEVKIAASHHMFGLRALPGFAAFPVEPSEAFPDRGTLHTFQESTYTVQRPAGTSSTERYALEADGALSIYVSGTGRTPTVIFPGGYGLMGDRNDYFFIDRSSTANSPSLGMFLGTRVVAGTTELAGAWHAVSLHLLFATTLVSAPGNVARAAFGTLTVAADPGNDPGSQRAITGTGTDSAGTPLDFAGSTIQYLLQGQTGDGTTNLTLNYRDSRQPANTADARVFRAAVGKDLLLAVDEDETDGETGLLLMTRAFDPATPADVTQLAGEFLVGGLTLFVNPGAPGTDGAAGRLTLTAQRGFRLDMLGSRNIDFSYSGTFTLEPGGRLEFQVDGTNERWHGSVTLDHHAIILVDDFVEVRANNTPELNLLLALRRKPRV